jgi:hypothetical protein
MAGKRVPSRGQTAAHPLRIAVKLNQRAPKPLIELTGAEKLLEERLGRPIGALPLLPLIESLDPKLLMEMADRARRSDPSLELAPPDFSTWYQIVCPADVNPDELAKALRQIDVVETAYVMRPVPRRSIRPAIRATPTRAT